MVAAGPAGAAGEAAGATGASIAAGNRLVILIKSNHFMIGKSLCFVLMCFHNDSLEAKSQSQILHFVLL